jgi:hypothetical protein
VDSGRTLRVSRTALDYSSGPLLASLLKGIGSKLFSEAPKDNPLPDTSVTLFMYDLGPGSKETNHLYIALGRIRIAEKTWDRFSIVGLDGWRFSSSRSILANVVNTEGSPFGVGLAGGATFDAQTRDTSKIGGPVGPSGQHTRLALYLFGHIDIVRARLPLHSRAFGFAFGTNLLQGSLLDDIVLGASESGLIGRELGLIEGIDFVTSRRDTSARQTRLIRAFLGVEFRL